MSSKENQVKKKEDALVITVIRLRPQVRAQLEQLAKQHRMSLSAFMRWMSEERVCYEEAA